MATIGIPTTSVSPMFHRGAYSNTATYAINDVVTLDGSSYINTDPLGSTGTDPTAGQNTATWKYLALKGEPGSGGGGPSVGQNIFTGLGPPGTIANAVVGDVYIDYTPSANRMYVLE